MIIVDNCILSLLSKIDHLDLLKYFDDVRTTNGVIQEIFRSEMDEIISPVSSSLQKKIGSGDLCGSRKQPLRDR